MAKEYWQDAVNQLKRRRRAVRRDRVALEEGAVVWNDVVAEITTFEKYLRDAMMKLSQNQGKGKTKAESITPEDILSKMNATAQSIEEKLDLVSSKEWRLLQVCIAAELEAFHQGKEILEQTFAVASGTSADKDSTSEASSKDKEAEPEDDSPIDAHNAGLHKNMYEDSDDGPDPDLLISHLGEDTE